MKFRNNQSYGKQQTVSSKQHQQQTFHWCIVTSFLLELLKQRVIYFTLFSLTKLPYSRSFPFQRTNNFGYVFLRRLYRRIYETKFQTHVSFLFLHFLFVVILYLILLSVAGLHITLPFFC